MCGLSLMNVATGGGSDSGSSDEIKRDGRVEAGPTSRLAEGGTASGGGTCIWQDEMMEGAGRQAMLG